MRHLVFFITACSLIAGLSISCSKVELIVPHFEVNTSAATYKVGEEITFSFEGNPENITFYSGEDGYRYDSVGLYRIEQAAPQLQITSAKAGGAREEIAFKLLVGTDFGEPTVSNIQTASWTDITDRFELATTTTSTLSGVVDLSDIARSIEQPLRFALKYESSLHPTIAHQIWSIRTFDLAMTGLDGSRSTLASLVTAGWSVLDVKNAASTWTVAANQVRIDGGARNAPDQEDWAITEPFDLLSTRDVYTRGIAVKNISQSVREYAYSYDRPGTYTVNFVAFNVDTKEDKKVVRKLDITIEP